MYLTCPSLHQIDSIRHGFFTREGGASSGLYASLNCGPGSGDDLQAVQENRKRVAMALGQPNAPVLTCHQIHSPNVATVSAPWQQTHAPQADALATKTPGLVLGVLTADCLPVLFADPKAKVVAAAHAGWKGAFDGVLEATLEAMRKLGAAQENILACIGPGIAQESYEVGPEFMARFLQQHIENARFFADSSRPGHHRFDLKAYALHRLKGAGLSHVNLLAHDTCFEENRFFSYRRSTLKGEKAYGRQMSAIVINN